MSSTHRGQLARELQSATGWPYQRCLNVVLRAVRRQVVPAAWAQADRDQLLAALIGSGSAEHPTSTGGAAEEADPKSSDPDVEDAFNGHDDAGPAQGETTRDMLARWTRGDHVAPQYSVGKAAANSDTPVLDAKAVKQRAKRELARAARANLRDLGMRQAGSRLWSDDHAWVLINVEFQPSAYSVGTFLNVGIQLLWDGSTSGHLTLGNNVDSEGRSTLGRIDINGRDFLPLDGEESSVVANAAAAGRAAREEVERLRNLLTDRHGYLEHLAAQPPQSWTGLNAGIAAALLGNRAKAAYILGQTAAALDPNIEWERGLSVRCTRLQELVPAPAEFLNELQRSVAISREALKLPPAPDLRLV